MAISDIANHIWVVIVVVVIIKTDWPTDDMLHELFYRSVGVSNFEIQHLEGLKEAGLPTPSVNQIELHPFQRRDRLVHYCKDHDIAIMGYSPLARALKFDDPDLIDLAKK